MDRRNESRRRMRRVLRERRHRIFDDPEEHGDLVAVDGIEPPSGDDLPSEHAGRPDVGSTIDRALRLDLLRRHEGDLSFDDAGTRLPETRRSLRDTEVGEPRRTVESDQNVLRREVSMDELERSSVITTKLVRRVKPLKRVAEDPQTVGHPERAPHAAEPPHEAAERVTLDVLHREKHALGVFIGVEDRDDVRVLDACDEVRLLEEAGHELRVLEQVRVCQLDCDVALEPGRAPRPPEVHRRHPAGGDR